MPQKAAFGGVFPRILQPANGRFGGRIRETAARVAIQPQQFAQRLQPGIARALHELQAGAGQAPHLIQAFFGEPASTGLRMAQAGSAIALTGLLPFSRQQVPAQPPGAV